MQGHVFNGHYLTWFDMAHTEMLERASGRPYKELVTTGVDVVVAEAGVRYLTPARFDDELLVAVRLDPPTDASLTSRFTVTRGGETVATGMLRHVCVDPATMAKRPWPAELRSGFAPFVDDEPPTPAGGRDGPGGPVA
jgi:acyl-CoA thioester hydrolase